LDDVKPIEDLTEDLIASIEVGAIPMIWGDAGLGKTALVNGLRRRMKLKRMVTLIGSLCDPTDINGFPTVGQVRVKDSQGNDHPIIEFAPRRWLLECEADGGMIFFDELTSSPPAVQAALLRSMLDKVFGDFAINPDKVAMIAAGNPPDIAVNGQELGAPMVNRLDHYQFPMGAAAAKEWAGNFASYWGDPRPVRFNNILVSESAMLRARSFVAGFIQRFPDRWHQRPGSVVANGDGSKPDKKNSRAAQTDDGQSGWPSPRSWDRVSWHIGRCIERDIPPIQAMRRVAAAVGTGAAVEFTQYLRETAIPDPEVLLADPDKFEPTGRPDLDFSILAAVAAAVEAHTNADRYKNAWKIISRSFGGNGNKGNVAYEAAAPAARRLCPYLLPANLPKVVGNMAPKALNLYALSLYELAAPFQKIMKSMGIDV
jgi:hypothetical protein